MKRYNDRWLPLLVFLVFFIPGNFWLLRFTLGDSQKSSDTGLRNSPEATLTHGPMVGGVSDTEATVFVRTDITATVSLLFSRDPELTEEIYVSSEVETSRQGDYTAHIPLTNLQPESTYYYSVLLNQLPCLCQASFSTAPAPESSVNFRFAIFSDLSWRPNFDAHAYQSAASDSPAFVLQIGDFDHRSPGSPLWPTTTVENWRAMHRDVLGDNAAGRDFAAHIAPFFPIYHIWDDHDFGANNADRTATWKPLATQAFLEYYPLPRLPNEEGGVWYSFRHAQTEFFVLDLRSQRDPNDDPPGPDKSMLDGGSLPDGQKEWLKDGLINSTATWKFIISSSVWNRNSKQVDSWFLFQDEQNELVEFIAENHITGIIVISGDLHSGGAIDNGTNSFFPELNIPTTNIHGHRSCTDGYCGTWSEGIMIGIVPSGYGLVMVEHNDETGENRVVLQVKGEDGSLRLQHTVYAPGEYPYFLPFIPNTQ